MSRHTNRTALITGAAGGIGSAIARKLRAEGASLVLVDRDEAALKALAEELGSAQIVCGDVSTPDLNTRAIATALTAFGKLDAVALNAGIEGACAPIGVLPVEEFDKVMSINVRGVFLGLSHAIPAMNAGGAIVLTSSTLGFTGTSGLSPYVTSKHAVMGLMRTAAIECAERDIRVNAINPGPIETRMVRAVGEAASPESPAAFRQALTDMVPMKRYGQPAEVANLVSFLLSDEASYCTGGFYTVDGAYTAV